MPRGSKYIAPIDPAHLASRDLLADGLMEAAEEGLVEADPEVGAFLEAASYEEEIKPLLDRIPEREADLIHLYFLLRKKQAEIAAIFGITQAAVSYRLDRGLQRLKFLLSIPQVDPDEMREDLARAGFPDIDVAILLGIWETTCQSEVAKNLNQTQGRVRHRFFTALGALRGMADREKEQLDEEGLEGPLQRYYRVFFAISENFNILREVKLPQWADRGLDCCSLLMQARL
jgi:hypothetical protein